ncbi:MAG: hypothetical protein ACREV4_15895 [Gammaproteobacteria bacterium]
MKAHNADFSDCLISVKDQTAGCTETVTFDHQAAILRHMRLFTT